MKKQPHVYIIGGPNGSGKTTFANEYFEGVRPPVKFLNADVIAAAISPMKPDLKAIQAGKLLLQQIEEYSEQKIDFAFESTLSGMNYVERIKKMKADGYIVHLIFLWIPDVRLSIERVKNRVRLGGHDIPELVIERRFHKGLSNFFNTYSKIADDWILFDNSKEEIQVVGQSKGGAFNSERLDLYKQLQAKYEIK